MPLSVDPTRHGYLRVTITGAWPSPIEQARFRAYLLDRGALTPNTCVLIDLRELTVPPSSDDVRNAVATAIAQETARVRRALLVGTPQQHAAARAIQELGGYEGAPIKVFKDEAAAVRWLTAKQEETSTIT